MHITKLTVHAPLNATMDGSLLGPGYATRNFSMQSRISQDAQQLGNAVITEVQQNNNTRMFLDAGSPLGAYAP